MERAVEWRFNVADGGALSVGGHRATIWGSPRFDADGDVPLARFNGLSDGLSVETNPIEGFGRFSIEVEFLPELGGSREQRFLHIQEIGSANRVLLETRLTADGRWYADTFVKSAGGESFLNDPSLTHPIGVRHTMSLRCDGKRMIQYVDGMPELEAALDFMPLGPGRTSIGMRIDRVHWFKGSIGRIRIEVPS